MVVFASPDPVKVIVSPAGKAIGVALSILVPKTWGKQSKAPLREATFRRDRIRT
ncbi:hypothetical protein GCM10007100_07240 [Roseibacillus persicicus]|uniref:Uncharacterized protein n=1 Tax=Roseibacillus persicicus TaxID=454148 RepID=A0A918TFT8_9BACT|nr:hypothetical protein GCM10007100_07240 [Roseibacillus persicicus]